MKAAHRLVRPVGYKVPSWYAIDKYQRVKDYNEVADVQNLMIIYRTFETPNHDYPGDTPGAFVASAICNGNGKRGCKYPKQPCTLH